jgi:hypothetical protein
MILPRTVMRFAAGGDIGFNAPGFKGGNIGGAEVAIVHGRSGRLANLRRGGRQGGQGFLFVVGVIGQAARLVKLKGVNRNLSEKRLNLQNNPFSESDD